MNEQTDTTSKSNGEPAGRPLHHDDLWAIPIPSAPCIARGGDRIAFVVTTPERDRDDYCSVIWIADGYADAEAEAEVHVRQLTYGPSDSAPSWSPSGGTLAFLRSKADGDAPQLHLLRFDGAEVVARTALAGGAGAPVWSPDGSCIAFSAQVDIAGASDHDAVEASRLDYKADGLGLHKGRRSQLFVLDVAESASAAARPRQLTFGDAWASSPVWSPDGSRLAYSTSRGPHRDLEVEAVVHTVSVDGGVPSPVSPAGGVYEVFDWSPDGSNLLVVGQPRLGPGNQHLYALPAGGGEPEPLAPGLDRNVVTGGPGYPGAAPRYRDGGAEVLFCVQEGGFVHVRALPAAGGDPVEVVAGERVVAGMSSAAGCLAFVAASAASPGEVWLLNGAERVLTELFARAVPGAAPLRPEAQTFTAPDGTALEGWLLRRRGAGPSPLLVDIHGGPHNKWSPVLDTAHLYHESLVAGGWSVLLLNPRASDGYGEAFRTAAVGAWGIADEGDFHAAVEDLVARGIADPARVAVSGYSYGGYMTCWLTARSDRFCAAVAGGCVSDLVSLAGTSDAGRFLADVEFGGSVVTAREALVASSPLTHVAGVHTPTLILHGEEDQRCPVGQAEQWFSALRAQRVPAELVRYPGQSHLFILNGRPSHRVDYARRLCEWVDEHASGTARDQVARRSKGRGSVAPADLRGRLDALVARHGVPGASVAVLAGGRVSTAAAGVLNVATGVAATEDSLFQIGSITKVYTASLVMQLVDEGRVALDTPVVTYLPELELADSEVAKQVTLRHLLTHTSGIQGDHFPDLGRGEDVVARFVASCAQLSQTHRIGATMSYCNAGYVICGRVVEQETGTTWDDALRSRLATPLGLDHTVSVPEDVLCYRAAMGHVEKDGRMQPASKWSLPRSCGPAGLVCATAADVVAFARMHLHAGVAPDGTQVLSGASVAAMQEPQVAVPDPYTLGAHWGLGWILFDWNGRHAFGHDGGTLGQSAYLRVVPDADVAVALLTNGGHTQDLFFDLVRPLLDELAGIAVPLRPAPPPEPVEVPLDEYVGVYERLGSRLEVERRDGRLIARSIVTGPLAEVVADPVTDLVLVAVRPGLFVTRQPGTQTWTPMVFYRLDDGARYVHFGARATPKVS